MKFVGSILLFAAYVLTSCLGLYLIKASQAWRSLEFVAGVGLYGVGAALWLVILRLFPLSLAFPIAAGALIICTILTGRIFIQETVQPLQIFGAGLIIVGIALSVAGSRST